MYTKQFVSYPCYEYDVHLHLTKVCLYVYLPFRSVSVFKLLNQLCMLVTSSESVAVRVRFKRSDWYAVLSVALPQVHTCTLSLPALRY